MLETIALIVIVFLGNTFFILGLQFAFSKDQVLEGVPNFYLDKLSRWNFFVTLSKPLFFCAPCMSSMWGWVGFRVITEGFLIWPVYYPAWVAALAGFIVFLNRITSK